MDEPVPTRSAATALYCFPRRKWYQTFMGGWASREVSAEDRQERREVAHAPLVRRLQRGRAPE